MKQLQPWILGAFAVLILAEMIWSWREKRGAYQAKETASNFFIFAVYNLIKPASLAWSFLVFSWFSQFSLFKIPNTVWATLLAVLFVDFLYYWQHRIMHEVEFFWTIHNVHHSSPWMNLTTALRLNWMGGLFSPFFYIPAVILGFSVQQVMIFFLLNLVFQFLLHTEFVGKLTWLEGWVNTPSAHRVHHGSNDLYIDKNHGGVLMIWDRMFGTYQPETEKVKYGVTTGFKGHNPFKAVFGPMLEYFRTVYSEYKQRRATETHRTTLIKKTSRVSDFGQVSPSGRIGDTTLP